MRRTGKADGLAMRRATAQEEARPRDDDMFAELDRGLAVDASPQAASAGLGRPQGTVPDRVVARRVQRLRRVVRPRWRLGGASDRGADRPRRGPVERDDSGE